MMSANYTATFVEHYNVLNPEFQMFCGQQSARKWYHVPLLFKDRGQSF